MSRAARLFLDELDEGAERALRVHEQVPCCSNRKTRASVLPTWPADGTPTRPGEERLGARKVLAAPGPARRNADQIPSASAIECRGNADRIPGSVVRPHAGSAARVNGPTLEWRPLNARQLS